jgi:hypothetical protein
MVKIERQQRSRAPGAGGVSQLAVELFDQAATVIDSCQRIVVGEMAKTELHLLALGDVDRDRRDADHSPIAAPRREREQHVGDRAVLSPALGLDLANGVPGEHPGDRILRAGVHLFGPVGELN